MLDEGWGAKLNKIEKLTNADVKDKFPDTIKDNMDFEMPETTIMMSMLNQ